MRRSSALITSLLMALLAAEAQAQQEFSAEGAKACLECHESDKIMGILDTPHADPKNPHSPASVHQCESCHGPSATHMNFPLHVGNIRFSRGDESTTVEARNGSCLECHRKGSRANWTMGPHGLEEIACVNCHSIHKSRDPALSQQAQTALCTEACHKTILDEEASENSSHPLTGEDRFLCTDCHNPHGPIELSTCNTCHPQNAVAFAKLPTKARNYHERALAEKIDCTRCHTAFVHAAPEMSVNQHTGQAP
jgi:DmsE family decaheme c-type cytochrome